MIKFILISLMAIVPGLVQAQEVRIVGIQPKYVTVQHQECHQVQVQTNNSGIGTVIGGVAGGIIGNQVGKGSGNTAATVAGAVVGGMVGNRIGSDQGNTETRQDCRMIPVTVQKGEIVTFEYRGRRFTQIFE